MGTHLATLIYKGHEEQNQKETLSILSLQNN